MVFQGFQEFGEGLWLDRHEHFNIHLEEFLEKKEILFYNIGLEPINDYLNIAHLIIDRQYVDMIKHALKPQRAFLLDD